MISKKMQEALERSSAIREMFEEGKRLSKQFGKEQVFDFSLGNPNLPAPPKVKEAIIDIVSREDSFRLHGYPSNQGYEEVRDSIAKSLNKRFQTKLTGHNICMTVGAAGGLNTIFKILLNPGDEVLTFSPYFAEYRGYVENFGGKLLGILPENESFQPNLDGLRKAITFRTKAVLINTPNNPTGVVYSEDSIKQISQILREKQKELGQDIYLISDEPYRELVYDGVKVPYLTHYYSNTMIVYSYSKTLSLPGERIGYLVIPDEVEGSREMIMAFSVGMRMLGFVNAPTLQQKVVEACLNESVDISYYERNRTLLYNNLKRLGFHCVKPEGGFYLFVKSPVADEKQFCEVAKQQNILMVPSSAFGYGGYVRIAYCVSYETIVNSLPQFEKLAEYYKKAGVL